MTKQKRYHKPTGTPSIDRDLVTDRGPQTRPLGGKPTTTKAWCYRCGEPHSYADCPLVER